VANGQVTISPIKVFPAGTVFLEPVVPDYANSDLRRPRLMLSMLTNKDDPAPWLKDLWASPIDSAGASVSRHQDLRPNTRQSLHIPADVTMTLLLSDSFETRCAPLFFPGIRVQQGQILDLGRLEFGPGITVAVKVIDSVGKPVKDARVYCLDDRYGQYGVTAPTNGSGIAEAHVAPSTKGKFALYFFGRSSSDRLETRVAYEVGALEDNGREFILQPSDEFLRRFREGRQERPMPLPLR
jgi:hypothetical protein